MVSTKNLPLALAEVYDIINHSDKKIKDRIPKNFILFLKENMMQDAKINIDYTENIKDQPLQYETKVILSIIYRDFLCDAKSKELLLVKEKKELAELEIKKQEKYSAKNIFKNRNEIEKEENLVISDPDTFKLIVYESPKPWYVKLFQKIRNRIFK